MCRSDIAQVRVSHFSYFPYSILQRIYRFVARHEIPRMRNVKLPIWTKFLVVLDQFHFITVTKMFGKLLTSEKKEITGLVQVNKALNEVSKPKKSKSYKIFKRFGELGKRGNL